MASAKWDWGQQRWIILMGRGRWRLLRVHGPAIFLTLISSPEYNVLP